MRAYSKILVRASVLGLFAVALLCGAVWWFWPRRAVLDVPQSNVLWPQGTVHYLHEGDSADPRILFIHGSPGDAHAWSAYLTDPISGFESFAVDRPGFGDTMPDAPVPSLAMQAAAIEPLLVERNGHWPIVVGHSLGATIAARVAVDFPDRVRGLVLVSAALDPALEETHWYNRLAEFSFIPRVLPQSLVHSNRELAPLRGELETLGPLLDRYHGPVVLLHGADDWLVPVANLSYAERHFKGAQPLVIRELDDESHFIIWTKPALVREAILEVAEMTR